jgi:hypothetical protein
MNRSIARDIKVDTQEIRNDTTAIKEDTTQILAEIARLQARLPEEERVSSANGFALQRYLDNLTSYAESSWEISDIGSNHSIEVEVPHSSTRSPSLASIPPPEELTMGQMDALERETSVLSSPPQNITPPPPKQKTAITQDAGLKRKTVEARIRRFSTPSRNNVLLQQESGIPQVPSVRRHDNPVPKTAYDISNPIDVQYEYNPPTNGHKRTNTIGGIFSRTNSIFGGKQPTNKEKPTTLPKSNSATNIVRPPSVGRASRKSTDSRRSISFGFRKKRSGSLSESEATIGEKPRRFSLLPESFSLKALGIGTEYGDVVHSPENEVQKIEGFPSSPPVPPKFANVAGFESSSRNPPPNLTNIPSAEPKFRHAKTEVARLAGLDSSHGPHPLLSMRTSTARHAARLESDSPSTLTSNPQLAMEDGEPVSPIVKAPEVCFPTGVVFFGGFQAPSTVIVQIN